MPIKNSNLILNKPITLKTREEIKELKQNFKSITKSEKFIKCPYLKKSLNITSKTVGVYKLRQSFLHLFQRASYRAFKASSEYELTKPEFLILFDQIFTSKNLSQFISNKYWIVFSTKTNQFVYIYKNLNKMTKLHNVNIKTLKQIEKIKIN